VSAVAAPAARRGRGWLLTAGVVLLVLLLAWHGAPAVLQILLKARDRALVVIAAHLPETFLAALGWAVLLPRGHRPGLGALFRLRLIKEAVNGLLPVAQVGGDVVRARLAVRRDLPLAQTSASCIADVGVATAALLVFALAGVAVAAGVLHLPQVGRIGFGLLIAALIVAAVVLLGERLGFLRLVQRLMERWRERLGQLAGVGPALREIGRRPGALAASVAWHLAAWGAGTFETWVAMWAIGLAPSLTQAFVLESLTQAIKGLGFAIPGALGVQEGGYVVLCAALGLPADQALALALLRRLRELVLGAAGLIAWRLEPARA
jgi:putative membrane protein